MQERYENQGSASELIRRLSMLESEVRRLRAELGSACLQPPSVPRGDFYALRMKLGDDSYGLPIAWVREIVRYVQLTRIADVPPFVVGTINYRGEILPVLDGRLRFGLPQLSPRRGTAIVIVQVGRVDAGFIVDSVRDVVLLASEGLHLPSGPLAQAEAVAALATMGEDVLQLVDIERFMSTSQWEQVHHAVTSTPCVTGVTDGDEGACSDEGQP